MAIDYTAKIAALEGAVGSGILTVESNGERMTYRSMDDLLKALNYMKAEQAKASGGGYATTLATFGGE